MKTITIEVLKERIAILKKELKAKNIYIKMIEKTLSQLLDMSRVVVK